VSKKVCVCPCPKFGHLNTLGHIDLPRTKTVNQLIYKEQTTFFAMFFLLAFFVQKRKGKQAKELINRESIEPKKRNMENQ